MTEKLRKKLYENEMESIASTAKALMEAVSHVTVMGFAQNIFLDLSLRLYKQSLETANVCN